MPDLVRFAPAAALAVGCVLISGAREQLTMQPRAAMRTIQVAAPGYTATDVEVKEEERRVAGFDDYVVRTYQRDSVDAFSVYVGYWGIQRQGKSTHSPKNCLPGGGWEPISASTRVLSVGGSPVPVNRYVIANKSARALVYYWYMGRGRAEASEYKVKWDLLRDAALFGRTDEAIVRVIVPFDGTGDPAAAAARADSAEQFATGIARQLVPQVVAALPVPPGGRAPLAGLPAPQTAAR